MSRRQTLQLQLELLRMRGAIQRAEVAAAVSDLRTGVRRFGKMVSAVSTVGAKLSGGGGWAQALLGVVGAVGLRPLWASLALAALRAVRRHPIATIAGAAGAFALVAWWRGRRARA